MKLENYSDLFKYSKELLDDDYNHGQSLVLKTKSKAADNVTVSSKPIQRCSQTIPNVEMKGISLCSS